MVMVLLETIIFQKMQKKKFHRLRSGDLVDLSVPQAEDLNALFEAAHVPVKQFVSGGNDGGSVQRTKSGVMTCVLSVPCRYIHSPASAVCLKDVESQAALAMAFLEDPRL